ncbi:alpha/beta hydrolase [Tropicibacter naphthalenivorans]|uniref:Alpha/beta hydrolase family protein n=1 Tax=Tropicibacter naphthalenivorans TaxID=441103 RepID=A0A0P1GLH9_9RHOB|nr:alpha/beta hydrolase [Tropicibacter naphthalenivorans]CUH76235.1 Alpha/beta hydrolase family protein [Tropicibacter naphthalenivorans]SMC39242.1 Alpha/beta hydrolase family protein [Tropicibacter naphthalenivorans]
MPMLRITATLEGAQLHGASAALRPVLRHALAVDPGPVTVMIHGYKYLPGHPLHCPHETIQSRLPKRQHRRVVSWPRHLGLRGQRGEGLGISFGWGARGSLWAAHGAAWQAGAVLADLLEVIAQLAPGRPVHLVAHSMGARVALRAISLSPHVQTAILMSGAEFCATARGSLQGKLTQVLNVTSRENDLFDYGIERLLPAPVPGDRTLGHGLSLPNLVTLQLDDDRSLHALRTLGFPIKAPEKRICHWSPYLRPGVFPLYRAVLAGRLPLPMLASALPAQTTPRWSRLRPRLGKMPPGLALP